MDPTAPHSHVPTAAYRSRKPCRHKHPGSMHECACVCTCVHININKHVRACAFVHRCACLYAHMLPYRCMLICTHVCIDEQARVYVCTNSFECLHLYVCAHGTSPLCTGLHMCHGSSDSIPVPILPLHSKVRSFNGDDVPFALGREGHCSLHLWQ